MKAMVITRYGSPEVFRLQERTFPAPRANEVLVRVHASSVNYGDLVARDFGHLKAREFNMPGPLWFAAKVAFGFRAPRNTVLGSEFSGVVEAVGTGVSAFRKGDQVFGHTGPALGAYAEFLCIPETGALALKPVTMNHNEAATVPYGATTALALLKPMGLHGGQSLLIVGASGAIGAAAVQLAKAWGLKVTAVCGPRRQEYVRSLGADTVLDYSKTDFTEGHERYDVVFDVLGRSRFSRVRRVLKSGGRYLLASFKTKKLLQMLWTSAFGDKKVVCGLAPTSAADLRAIGELVGAGRFRAFVDRVFPLEAVADAHRYAESGGRQGVIAISLS